MSSLSDPDNFVVVWDPPDVAEALVRNLPAQSKLHARKFNPAEPRDPDIDDDPIGELDHDSLTLPTALDELGRAAGIDTHPGGEQLKHYYWLHGAGAAKWSTWTELYHHLVKHMSPGMAKRVAAQWFHDRYGFWPGSDVNKVVHGKPPRGKVVGPG